MHYNISREMEENVNEWLHFSYTEYCNSPIDTLRIIVHTFFKDIDRYKFTLNVNKKKLFEIMCEAMCMYYIAQNTHKIIIFNNNSYEKKKWDQKNEILWMDFLTFKYFNTTYWDNFWSRVHEQTWEMYVPQWRFYLASLLPYYISRDEQLLIDNGLLFETEDGEAVTAENYDSCNENMDDT